MGKKLLVPSMGHFTEERLTIPIMGLNQYYQVLLALAMNGVYVDEKIARVIAKKYGGISTHSIQVYSVRLRKWFPDLFPKPAKLGMKKRIVSGKKDPELVKKVEAWLPSPSEIKIRRIKEAPVLKQVREWHPPGHYQEIIALALDKVYVDRALAEEIAARHPGVNAHSVQVASVRLRKILPDLFPKPEELGMKRKIVRGGMVGKQRQKEPDTRTPYYHELIRIRVHGGKLNKSLVHALAKHYSIAPRTVWASWHRLRERHPELFKGYVEPGRKVTRYTSFNPKSFRNNVLHRLRHGKFAMAKGWQKSAQEKWRATPTAILAEVNKIVLAENARRKNEGLKPFTNIFIQRTLRERAKARRAKNRKR